MFLKRFLEGVITITPELKRSECLRVAQNPGQPKSSSEFWTTTVSASRKTTAPMRWLSGYCSRLAAGNALSYDGRASCSHCASSSMASGAINLSHTFAAQTHVAWSTQHRTCPDSCHLLSYWDCQLRQPGARSSHPLGESKWHIPIYLQLQEQPYPCTEVVS